MSSREESFIECVLHDDVEEAESLLEGGFFSSAVDVNTLAVNGQTALMIASDRGTTSMVELLISYGADVDIICKRGGRWSALMYAAVNGYSDICSRLLSVGASPDPRDKDQATPLIMAAASPKSNAEVIEVLLSFGADPNARDKTSTTALMMAAQLGKYKVVEVLLMYLAEPDIRDADGSTAIMYASSHGQTGLVELLLRGGASIDIQDNDGFSALMDAAKNGRADCVSLLLSCGAKPTYQHFITGRQVSALDLASNELCRKAVRVAFQPDFTVRNLSPLQFDTRLLVASRSAKGSRSGAGTAYSKDNEKSGEAENHETMNLNHRRSSSSSQRHRSKRTSPSPSPSPVVLSSSPQSLDDQDEPGAPPPLYGSPLMTSMRQPTSSSSTSLNHAAHQRRSRKSSTSSVSSVASDGESSPSPTNIYSSSYKNNHGEADQEELSSRSSRRARRRSRSGRSGRSGRNSSTPMETDGTYASLDRSASKNSITSSRHETSRRSRNRSVGRSSSKTGHESSDSHDDNEDLRMRELEGREQHHGLLEKEAEAELLRFDHREVTEHKELADDMVFAAGAIGAGAGVSLLASGSHAIFHYAPVFNAVFFVIEAIGRQVDNVVTNKDNCRFIAERCVMMKGLLQEVEKNFHPTKHNIKILVLLHKEFERTLELINRYTQTGWLRKLISASSLHTEFVRQDSHLTSLVGDLCAGMHSSVLANLRAHHPYVKHELGEIRHDIQHLTGHVTDELQELKGLLLSLNESKRNDSPNEPGSAEHLPPVPAPDELSKREVSELVKFCTRRNRIGKGTFGTVYKGELRGMTVAIKELDIGNDREAADRAIADFHQEVKVLRVLRSSRLVQFVGACTQPSTILIVTEYIPGGNLFHLLQQESRVLNNPNDDSKSPEEQDVTSGASSLDLASSPAPPLNLPLSLLDRLRIAEEVAIGLNYLHCSNPPIIHRDVKSRNILLDAHGHVKICDFGLSRTMNRSVLTATQGSVGTPQYMSPEALKASPLAPSSDVYSFGILLYELFIGDVPWSQLSMVQVVTKVLVEKQRVRLPSDKKDAIPSGISNLIKMCVRHTAKKRPSMREVLKQIRKVREKTISKKEKKRRSKK